ncbi:MAG: hypothetical protein P1U89_23290 [Verrucomicrobiales bacterium]|nr:hypothetical protein [Verrucomicrobiales bacterium]
MVRLWILPVFCFFSLIVTGDEVARQNQTSREIFAPSDQPRPEYLKAVRGEVFGQKITRVTGDPGAPVSDTNIVWSRPARHIYSMVAAWDCSDSLLAIRNAGATKIDGSGAYEWLLAIGPDYQKKIPLQTSFTEFRWRNATPKRMLLITPHGLSDYDPLANKTRPIPLDQSILSLYTDIGLSSQGNLSDDDRLIALIGTHRETGVRHALIVSLEKNEILAQLPFDIPRLDFATVSPKGRFLVVNGEFTKGEADRTRVYSFDGQQIGQQWDPYGLPSHYDLTTDSEGREIAVGVAKSRAPGIDPGSLVSRDLETGEIKLLLRGGYAMHISCRNLKLPGWAFVSYSRIDMATYPPFSNELIAVRTDGSETFRRICQFQSESDDYWCQPQACPNFSGTRAIFASNWRVAGNGAEAYVVETGVSLK